MVGVRNEAAGGFVPGICTWRAFTRHLLLSFKNRDHYTPEFPWAESEIGGHPQQLHFPITRHRGMEFLHSLNRLNVAVSRAQCVAVIVANPGAVPGTVSDSAPDRACERVLQVS
jgi:hypothetical protein